MVGVSVDSCPAGLAAVCLAAWKRNDPDTAGPLAVVDRSHVEAGRITRIRVTVDPRPLLS